jgi:hypothetical protein
MGESQSMYVDVYYAADFVLVGIIFILNLIDAGLTLHHISLGGIEQNPLMDRVLRWGPGFFLLEKLLLVGLCLMALIVNKEFRLAQLGAWLLLLSYSLLMVQHLSLLL